MPRLLRPSFVFVVGGVIGCAAPRPSLPVRPLVEQTTHTPPADPLAASSTVRQAPATTSSSNPDTVPPVPEALDCADPRSSQHPCVVNMSNPQSVRASLAFPAAGVTVSPEGMRALREVAAMMKAEQLLEVEVEGHADGGLPDQLAQRLSQQRADNARQLLIEQGIPAARIVAHGLASSRPRHSPPNTRNHRVTFRLIERTR